MLTVDKVCTNILESKTKKLPPKKPPKYKSQIKTKQQKKNPLKSETPSVSSALDKGSSTCIRFEKNLGSEMLGDFTGDTQQRQKLNSDLPNPIAWVFSPVPPPLTLHCGRPLGSSGPLATGVPFSTNKLWWREISIR